MILELTHSGVGHEDNPPGRGSGRFAWGSGENPGQHQFDFLSEVKNYKKKGLRDGEIARILLGPKRYDKKGNPVWNTSNDLRAEIAIQRTALRSANRARAIELLDKNNGNVSAVGRAMGINESTVRSLLDPIIAERTSKYENTAEMLKRRIETSKSGIIDVSRATEYTLGCTDNTKKVAIALLEKEGYVKTWIQVPQLGTQNKTQIMVLAKPFPGEDPKQTFARVQQNKYNVDAIQDYTPDEGKTWWVPEFPESIDSKRIKIRYAEEGGVSKDGVIEINPKAKDLSLEGSRYAQVRIAVDGTHYMKGMAIYTNETLPPGIDVIYNTNKKKGTPPEKVFKELKKKKLPDGTETDEIDRENPFGALIKSPKERDGLIMRGGQHYYTDENGNRKLSPINKLQDEGDWDNWSRTLSAQFLSKQPIKMIKQQIDLSVADKREEFEKIKNLNNVVIKQKLLEEFASSCDANAVDLSVKGVKNQAFQVIIPIPSLKNNEVYAPNYKDGDTLCLVRYPHGGIFEIPRLRVNNKHPEAKAVIGGATDAIGINQDVAEILSGADFDGDTVVVIPEASNKLKIHRSERLDDLIGWDPKEIYKLPDSAPKIANRTKQIEMGKVTNLITDMTVQGATEDQLVRAVKHSMVVIDSEKHHLDYKQSAKDNRISDLKDIYQKHINPVTGNESTGASTIFSKSKNTVRINKRREITNTKEMTPAELKRWEEGYKVYRDTGEKIVRRVKDPKQMTPAELLAYNAGKKVYRETEELRQEELPRMSVADDARDLVRDRSSAKEMAYADYANELKRMAREARKISRSIKPYPVSKEARKTYAKEVDSLNAKLRIALSNSPKERKAQMIANMEVSERIKSNPDMDFEHRKREEARELQKARAIVGAKKQPVEITDREWEAIQANAVPITTLRKIVDNTDQDKFKQRATPRSTGKELTSAQISKAKAMMNSGMYTQKEIAELFGVSASSISKAVKE